LLWMNGEYIRKTPADKLAAMAKPFFQDKNITAVPQKTYEQAVALEHEKIKLLTDVPKLIDFLLWDEFEYREEAVTKVLRADGAGAILDGLSKRLATLDPFDIVGIETLCKTLAKEKGVKNGAIFHPLRVSVSGRTEGPSLWHMVEFLGKKRTLERITKAQSILEVFHG
jgi:glutamyl/glutaminyl-tRNA synthetase